MSEKSEEIIVQLKSLADPQAVKGKAKFGINPQNTLGISIPALRQLAKENGRDHGLAEELWSSGIHEAQLLACFIDDPQQVTQDQMERWVADFDSWDVCDQCCSNLFDRTPYAYPKTIEWSTREAEFVRRAGYVMMACLAVHDKQATDDRFETFFPLIIAGATDERNFVKKAINWAFRQKGKRNANLNGQAIEISRQILQINSKSARWIASDALRELTSEAVQSKIHREKLG
jgi:3-methyladenine DNA glycosylase AlkD